MDDLPVGVLRVGPDGTILDANRTAGGLVGREVADLVGRSVLDFDADAASGRGMAHLAFSAELDETMGPVPIAYLHADGTTRHGDLWATNQLAGGLGELVVVVVPDSSAPSIAAAQSSVAEGAAVDTTLELLSASLGANPFCAAGCWLVHDDTGRRLVGADALPEAVQVALTTHGTWWRALRSGALVDVPDVAAEADEAHPLLLAAGIRAWWLLPVPRGISGTADAGIMVVRDRTGAISPNQAEHLHRIVTTAGLAFERAAMQERLTHAAFHDSLTGVGNRERFFERATPETKPGTALLYVDLDDFKPVNDGHGHSTGDLVLVTVADRLRRAVRPSDRITRMGGDEFVVECAGTVDDAEAIGIAERIIEAVLRPITLGDVTVEVGASVGIARTAIPMPIDWLLEQSDAALYAAKSAGRGRWHLAGPTDGVRAADRRAP